MGVIRSEMALAARNVRRQGQRSAIAIGAIAFGIIALIIAGGFIDWILMMTRETTIHAFIGHIQVMRPGYREEGISDPYRFLLPSDSGERSKIERTANVKVVGSRLSFSGLISFGESTISFVADGVDTEKEPLISQNLIITSGEGLSSEQPNGIILGRGLASNLGVKIGDQVVLVANTRSGGIGAVECRVRGTFYTVAKAYDDTALRMPIETARQLLKVSGAHVWIVLLDSTEVTGKVNELLSARFGRQELDFVPWMELADYYNKTSKLFNRQVSVIKIIIGAIIVLSISNSLVMNVMERTGEIGTAMALGIRRSKIMRLFLLEGLLLGLFGGLIGVVLGCVLAILLSWVGIPMPPPPGMDVGYSAEILLSWGGVFDALVLAVGTTLIAALYPSWRASRMIIVDALRVNR